MAKYEVNLVQETFYTITVDAEGIADSRRKAKEWAAKADPVKLAANFFAAGPFEARQTRAVRPEKAEPKTRAARKASK